VESSQKIDALGIVPDQLSGHAEAFDIPWLQRRFPIGGRQLAVGVTPHLSPECVAPALECGRPCLLERGLNVGGVHGLKSGGKAARR
jgi:hypothetical protein